MTTREEIIDRARSFIGTPFLHRGRSKYGADCIGLTALVADIEDAPIDYDPSGMGAGSRVREELLEAGFRRTRLVFAQGGDLVTFTRPGERDEIHAAILTPTGMIHVTRSTTKVVEEGIRRSWRRLIHSAYVFPGVEEVLAHG